MDPMLVKEEHHDGEYGNQQWIEIHDYQSQHMHSPIHEYSEFGYMSSTHGIPMEPVFQRTMPLSYSTHQQPPPLVTAQWPSMLTNPSRNPPPPLSVQPIQSPPLAPLSTYSSSHSLPPPVNPLPVPSARRTLTDQDRRRMCQYHEDNPTVKQTEIGAMFGVERSTVSKVLRQKDKYLSIDDGSKSPIKRTKGKFPDIERALSNWARNHQRQGFPLSDSIIRDKARFFANTVGSSESHAKVNSNSWLEKFKQKNHLLGAKPRKPSDANDSDSNRGLNTDSQSGSQTPNGVSPISPSNAGSGSPMSPSRSGDGLKTESPNSYIDLSTNYRHVHSQSATSSASCFSDITAPSSFSPGPTSPTSPFFSPDSNCGASPFLPSQQSRLMTMSNSDTVRPRSQTFPKVAIEPSFISLPESREPLTPKYLDQKMAAPALGTPLDDVPEQALRFEPSVYHSQSQHGTYLEGSSQDGSPASMGPPRLPATGLPSPNASNISSPIGSPPSQDEARRALEIVMNFLRRQPSGLVHSQEYKAIENLMEKLTLHGTLGELPGGMHSMHFEEKESGRKRSIHSL